MIHFKAQLPRKFLFFIGSENLPSEIFRFCDFLLLFLQYIFNPYNAFLNFLYSFGTFFIFFPDLIPDFTTLALRCRFFARRSFHSVRLEKSTLSAARPIGHFTFNLVLGDAATASVGVEQLFDK